VKQKTRIEDEGSRRAPKTSARSSTLHPPSSSSPIRILTAVPICDGHDSAITTINMELIRGGMEVIYLGFHRPVRDIVRAAIQEDVAAIGLSSYNGGHVEFFSEIAAQLGAEGATDIGVFGGGGGTISHADARLMQRRGVDRIFFAGTPLDDVVRFARETYGRRRTEKLPARIRSDRDLAKLLSSVEEPSKNGQRLSILRADDTTKCPLVIGITGPGGAGKTTLIDELVLRFLHADPAARIAILSHDPSLADNGALLGDRAAMIHAQHDRVFMRSLATRGHAGGLSSATDRCLRLLREVTLDHGRFDVILVETVGIGQEAAPFARGLVDHRVLVMSADYGSRLQLQKIAMLDAADIVVVNKSDLAASRTAATEIEQRLAANHRNQTLVSTCAKRHRDGGVDRLFELLRGTGVPPVSVGRNRTGPGRKNTGGTPVPR
jgi:methylmalonyl-CoA mutase cobalamin-binding domain/chain